jgi:hypothetical protein
VASSAAAYAGFHQLSVVATSELVTQTTPHNLRPWACYCLQAQQNKTDFKAALESKGFKLAAALFDIANMTNALNRPAAVYTVLV